MDWGLIFIGTIVLLIILHNPGARSFVMAVTGIVLLVAAFNVFVKTASCAEESCAIQPSWAGFCTPNGGSIAETNGTLYLVPSKDGQANATCVDIRIWD